MLKPLRKTVLVDMGPPCAGWDSEIIVCPDEYKKLNNKGTIRALGARVTRLSPGDIGKECIIGLVLDEESRISPRHSADLGLPRHWHVLCPERQVISVHEAGSFAP